MILICLSYWKNSGTSKLADKPLFLQRKLNRILVGSSRLFGLGMHSAHKQLEAGDVAVLDHRLNFCDSFFSDPQAAS
jgi:hypothetical protein